MQAPGNLSSDISLPLTTSHCYLVTLLLPYAPLLLATLPFASIQVFSEPRTPSDKSDVRLRLDLVVHPIPLLQIEDTGV